MQKQNDGKRAASGGALMGMMQDHPLVVSELLEYAVKVHGSREIVSRTVEDPSKVHRYVSICVALLCFVLFKACHASCSSRLATLTVSS